ICNRTSDRLRVSIRQVDASDQHPVYRSFDIACLGIPRIPRQAGSREHRVAFPRQDRHAVPGAFAKPDSAIAEVTKGTCRKCPLLLKANDVGLFPCEPSRQIVQTLVDVVDVKSDDLQWPSLTRKKHSVLTRASYCEYIL